MPSPDAIDRRFGDGGVFACTRCVRALAYMRCVRCHRRWSASDG
ncbi:hypothetical protein BSIN_0409 [Burkholderia singularis]|uniref:Uncharacterized protein n=1 Tax=Burkholderia singularis TaxID=1503053 RepID=A0A238H601_9BURK|nr:hypothetical protein BSIN_0409 [Burkholderia singularis]